MPRLFFYLTLLPVLFLGSTGLAMERFDIVTTEVLEKMLKDREKGQMTFVLVNTLDELIYRDRSIPGSANVPWSRVEETAHRLGPDKEKLIITY